MVMQLGHCKQTRITMELKAEIVETSRAVVGKKFHMAAPQTVLIKNS